MSNRFTLFIKTMQVFAFVMCLHTFVGAQTTWSGPATGGSWFLATNWSNGLPSPGNNAQIFGTPVILIDGALSVNFTITNYGTLEVSRPITVALAGAVENVGTIQFVSSTGTLSNAGSYKNYGTTTLATATAFTNEVSGAFENLGTFNLATILVSRGSFINSGTINATLGTVQIEGTIDNRQTLNTKTLAVRPGAQLTNQFGANITIAGTGSSFVIEGPVQNLGNIINQGITDVKANLTNGGSIVNEAAGVLTVFAAVIVQNQGGTITNRGRMVNQGTINNGNALLNEGVFENFATLNNRNRFENTAGGTFSNKSTGTLDMDFGSNFLNSSIAINEGIWVTNGAIEITALGRFDNPGTFTVRTGSVFTNNGIMNQSGTFGSDNAVNNNNRWVNTGSTLIKSGSIFTNRDSVIITPIGKIQSDFEFVNDIASVFINQGEFFVAVRAFLNGTTQNDGLIRNSGDIVIRQGGTLLNREIILEVSGNLRIDGTLTNQKNIIIDECSSMHLVSGTITGTLANQGSIQNAGIFFRRGTYSGNAVQDAGGYIHTAATSAAPTVCRQNAPYPADGTGAVKVYAQSLIAFATFDSCANSIYLGDGIARPVYGCADIGTTKSINILMRLRTGDSLTCVATVRPFDALAPNFTGCPTDQRIFITGESSTATWTPPVGVDNCTTVSLTTTQQPGATFPVGITGVSYIATDTYGNSNECQFRIDVVKVPAPVGTCGTTDVTPPVIVGCPTNITKAIIGTTASVTWSEPSATDACMPIRMSTTRRPGEFFLIGSSTVTYTATDARNNTATCAFTVTLTATDLCTNDVIPPFVANCPGNLYLPANPQTNTAVALWNTPFPADNCEVATFTASHAPGAIFPVGATTVSYTARDTRNNTGTCAFIVTVASADPCPGDVAGPVITGCPASRTVIAATTTATTTWAAPTATDACAPVQLVGTHTSGSVFQIGNTTVTYVASDRKGNKSTCAFLVTVTNPCTPDATAPVIAGCPANQSINSLDPAGIVVNWVAPTVSDGCGPVNFTASYTPGSFFAPGLTTVAYRASDAAGNTAVCTFNISISACNNVTVTGTIAGNQTICPTADPLAFTQTVVASGGGTGALQYQWQQTTTNPATNPTSWVDVGGATIATFDAAALAATTWYRRGVKRTGCADFVYSNTLLVTVTNTPPVVTCKPATKALPAGGGAVIITDLDVVLSSSAPCGTVAGFSFSPSSFGTTGVFPVVVTATSTLGATSTCTAQVTITGAPCTTPPTVTCRPATVQLPASGPATITAATVVLASTAGCGTITNTTLSVSSFATAGTFPVTVTVTNSNGVTASCVAQVTVTTAPCTTPPTVTCRPATVQLPTSGPATITAATVVLASTAGCGTITNTTLSVSSFATAGTFPVTVTVTNSNGATASCVAQVTVTAGGDPCALVVATGSANSISVSGVPATGITQIQAFNSAWSPVFTCTGNCTTGTQVIPNLGLGLHYVKVNLFTANWVPICEVNTTATVGGQPCNTPPTIVCKPASKVLPAGGSVSITSTDVIQSSTAGCGTITNTTLSQSTFTAVGTFSVTVTITNINSVSTSCAAQVTITSGPCTTPPTVVCRPASVTLPTGGGSVSITSADVVQSSTAGCGTITNTTLSQSTFTTAGTYPVTVTVTNSNGTTASCIAQVTVAPISTDPCTGVTITSGASQITIGGLSTPIVQVQVFTADWISMFNCPNTCTKPTQVVSNLAPGNYNVKVNLYTASWQPICEKLVTIAVGSTPCTTPPTVTCQAATKALPAGGAATIVAADVVAATTAGCGTITNTTLSPSSFTVAGIYTVTTTVTNTNGATASCTSLVTITSGNTDPCAAVTAIPSAGQITISGLSTPIVQVQVFNSSWNTVLNCPNTCTRPTQVVPSLANGLYYVKVNLYNANWQPLCEKIITVTVGGVACTTPPVVVCKSASLTLPIGGGALAITAADVIQSTTPNCGTITTTTISPNSVSAAGIYTVTVTVTNSSGISAICSSPVTVTNAPPSGTCANNILPNPGYESGLTGWWTYGNVVISNTNAQAGTSTLQNCDPGGSGGGQSVAARPGRQYTMRVFGRTTGAPQFATVSMKFMNSSFVTIGQEYQQFLTSATAYTEYTLTQTAPAGTAFIQVWSWKGNGGCLFIDSWCLTETVIAATLVQNQVLLNASQQGSQAQLRIIGTSSGDDAYLIERSHDGVQFDLIETIEETAAAGQISQLQSVDLTPLAGQNLYRVTQIKADGSKIVSDVQSLMFGADQPLVVYPNPASDLVTIQLPADAAASTISLINQVGRIVQVQEFAAAHGAPMFMSLDGVEPGFYFLQAETTGKRTMMTKLIVTSAE
jgi:HYR domain/Secretion system C-terminal sorting domain